MFVCVKNDGVQLVSMDFSTRNEAPLVLGSVQAPERFSRVAWGPCFQAEPSYPQVHLQNLLSGFAARYVRMPEIYVERAFSRSLPPPPSPPPSYRWVSLLEAWRMALCACGILQRYWQGKPTPWQGCRSTQER